MKEIWRDIQGYEGLYQVSNLGRVRSLRFGRIKNLKCSVDKDGYLYVLLCVNYNQKCYKIHRLVAQAFIPNSNNWPEVNHKDEDKKNNCVDNLEWCDRKYNINYGTCSIRVGKSNTNGKCSKQVMQINNNGDCIKVWPSLNEIKRELGYSMSNISMCCNHKRNRVSSYGYKWEWV